MNELAEFFSALADEVKKADALIERPINHTFSNEDEAFAYYRHLAALQPGDTVAYTTTHGEKRGVFLKFNDRGMLIIFGWEDDKHTATALSPLCIDFSYDPDDIDDDELEEFSRT